MARWSGGDDSRWEVERGRWGDERNAGRWRDDDERGGGRFGRDEGNWPEGDREARPRDEWRGSGEDWRGEQEWRGREPDRDRDPWRGPGHGPGHGRWAGRGRWEELRPGERRTYPPGRRELVGREDLGREDDWRARDAWHDDESRGGRFDRARDVWRGDRERDYWQSRDWEGASPGYRGLMGGPYGGGGGYGAGYGPARFGPEERGGRDAWRDEGWRHEGRDRDEGGMGMMDRLREGVRKLTGRGPKGYRRPDERIRDDVSERIARSAIDSDEVEVKVENGEVTLSGTVASRNDKRRLEDLAEDVFGVDEVHNHLRVSRPTAGATPGAAAGSGATPSGLVGTGQPATGKGPSTGAGISPQPSQPRSGTAFDAEPGKTH